MKQPGFFDLEQRYRSLEGSDPLQELSKRIAWEEFRPLVEQVRSQERGAQRDDLPGMRC